MYIVLENTHPGTKVPFTRKKQSSAIKEGNMPYSENCQSVKRKLVFFPFSHVGEWQRLISGCFGGFAAIRCYHNTLYMNCILFKCSKLRKLVISPGPTVETSDFWIHFKNYHCIIKETQQNKVYLVFAIFIVQCTRGLWRKKSLGSWG